MGNRTPESNPKLRADPPGLTSFGPCVTDTAVQCIMRVNQAAVTSYPEISKDHCHSYTGSLQTKFKEANQKVWQRSLCRGDFT